jgi:hypothetical protein
MHVNAISSDRDDWICNTRLFRACHDRQHEISVHKWYESEKAGHDIGWERATVSYMLHLAHTQER